jgi:hypothetical protein
LTSGSSEGGPEGSDFEGQKEGSGETDAGPQARTLAGTRDKLVGMRRNMPWSIVSQNQTNQTVHGHG